jgi:two-component system, sensor histidine kinase PhcS
VMKETLDDIQQGMGRIRSVISDLRAFAYPTQLSGAEAFTLDDVMSTAQRLTAHELNDVTVSREGIKGFTARGSKDQVVHILMNLLVNAAHATKGKPLGRPARVDITCEPRGELLGVTVRDNGCGVKPEHMPRLFEPFFTTKEKGKGTGLGLSICHTIVENHGGRMSVNSVEGQWTAVSFELPAARQEA